MTTDGATLTFVPGAAALVTSLPPEVDVVIDGDTWILPFDTSMEIPQTDGSTITLGPKEVRVGSQTFPVPSATGTTTLSSGGVSVTFQPGPPATGSPPSGGLLAGLQALQPAANAVNFMVSEIAAAGSSWASGASSDSDFFSILGSLLDDGTSGMCYHQIPSINFS